MSAPPDWRTLVAAGRLEDARRAAGVEIAACEAAIAALPGWYCRTWPLAQPHRHTWTRTEQGAHNEHRES